MDRIDLKIEVPPVSFQDLDLPSNGESSAEVASRVLTARELQEHRFKEYDALRSNADAQGELLEDIAAPDGEGRALLSKAAETFGLTARGYHRVLRVARTIADLDQSDKVHHNHIAEAISYRMASSNS